ncbi:hypothetical protein VTL71DRAFT_5102 [Oculimacula yallundae]|uniref:Uncharacterized protein n=1 Tax=Oculimacula yallundae TaxID=86028 RepID=A0ABR4C0T1_9HELO
MLTSIIELGVGPMPGFEDWASMPRDVLMDLWKQRGNGSDIFDIPRIVRKLVAIERRNLFNWMCLVTAIHGEINPDVLNLAPIIVRRVRMGNQQIWKAKARWGQEGKELESMISYWADLQW